VGVKVVVLGLCRRRRRRKSLRARKVEGSWRKSLPTLQYHHGSLRMRLVAVYETEEKKVRNNCDGKFD
jgi:hypothetical protein